MTTVHIGVDGDYSKLGHAKPTDDWNAKIFYRYKTNNCKRIINQTCERSISDIAHTDT